MKFSTFTVRDNSLSIFIELTDSRSRKASNERTSAELEKLFLERLDVLRTAGLEVAIKSQQGGPPTGAPVSIKLLANSTEKLPDLKRVVRDFETFLKTLSGTKNVNNTSQDSPGEIIFTINRERAAVVGVSPLQVYGEISNFARGVKAGTIKIGDDDMDITVKSDTHYTALNLEKILGQKITTKSGPLTLGSLVTYQFSNALIDVRRVDGDLTISVESDVRDGFKAGDLLIELNKYAEEYAYPEGVSYKK